MSLLGLLNNDDARFGLGLLAAAGPSHMGLGQRLQSAVGTFDEYKKDQARTRLFDTQMQMGLLGLDRAKREEADELAIRGAAQHSFRSPEMAAAMSVGPTPDGGVVQFAPGFDTSAFLQRLSAISPLKAIEYEQKLAKDNSPITVAAGASLVDRRTMKPVFTAPKEQSEPAAIQEYKFAQSQGYQGSFEQWDRDRKKAGATNVSMSVNTEKSLLNDIASGLGKNLVTARDGAQAALGTINTVSRLTEALDSGKVLAGPTSNFRQFGLQIGNVLGVSGKDANERMVNTRQAIQSLAQLELDAAQQMKGQGQITEAERDIIRRAAAGDIEKMTVPELRTLATTLDKTARAKIQGYNTQVQPLLKNPNAAPLAPFLGIQEPAARQAPNVLRFDAQGNPVR
jgi:hypothetical protein